MAERPQAKPPPFSSQTPAPDAEAERIFGQAQRVWRSRQEVPFVTYAVLQVYQHSGKTFSDWWQDYYRSSDRRLVVRRIVDPDAERQRLKGFPISILFFKVGDTNAAFPPIHVEDPIVEPYESFGMAGGGAATVPEIVIHTPQPNGEPPAPLESPLREIGHVEAETRIYDVRLAGTERVGEGSDYHLLLTPLRDPKVNRLREAWVSTDTYRTDKLVVSGIYNGEPYNAVRWIVRYTTFGDRQYVQQIKVEDPMRFGLDTVISEMELNFVDYRFDTIPSYFFDRMGL